MTAPISDIRRAYKDFLSDPRCLGDSLLHRLCCPYRSVSGPSFYPEGVSASELLDLRECLPQLFSSIAEDRNHMAAAVSLLVGMQQYGCLSTYPSTEKEAYALAAMLLCYSLYFNDVVSMTIFTVPYVCTILNTWLKPATPWTDIPGAVTLCRHMFGHAWCTLTLAEDYPDDVGAANRGRVGEAAKNGLDLLVKRVRPPFLPGLCAEQAIDLGIPLPDIGVSQ
jgi:hypothetical protein